MKKGKITFVYSYWESPKMFKVHQQNWMGYPKEVLERMEFIVVDDGSIDRRAIDNIIVPKDFPLRVYMINKKVTWNWRAARNIGVYESEPKSWILITDMDLLVPLDTVKKLFVVIDGKCDEEKYYTFDRATMPNMHAYKNHPNTYFLHRSLYLIVKGYDEIVSGIYGLDGIFRRRLDKYSKGCVHLSGTKIIHYYRNNVDDASVSSLKRKEGRDTPENIRIITEFKNRFRNGIVPDILTFPFERQR